MTKLQLWIRQACDTLGLGFDLNYRVGLSGHCEVEALARIRGIGHRNGMLIVTSYDTVSPCGASLMAEGYGFAVLDEPRDGEDFDLQSFVDMFRDWGWTGSNEEP